MPSRLAPLALLVCLASPATARDLVLSLGYGQFSAEGDREVAMLGIEAHTDRRGGFLGARWGLGVAGTFDDDGAVWVGLGPSAEWDLGRGWFVEASVMPGYYNGGSGGIDLGSELEIRSLIGIGREIGARSALSLALSHKSNADIGDINPGMNSLSLRLHWRF